MRNELIQKLQMPPRTILNRKIPKKQFYEQADLTKQEKELLVAEVEGIYLLSICRQDTLNVPKYVDEEVHYEEVYWIYISFKTMRRHERICRTIHRTFPNPVILICSNNDKEFKISIGHKRKNQNDSTKIVLEDIIFSPFINLYSEDDVNKRFIERLMFPSLSHQNLYAFFESIVQATYASQLIEFIGSYPRENQKLSEVITLLKELLKDDEELIRLKNKHDELTDFGEKMNVHIKMKHVKSQREQLIKLMKELC